MRKFLSKFDPLNIFVTILLIGLVVMIYDSFQNPITCKEVSKVKSIESVVNGTVAVTLENGKKTVSSSNMVSVGQEICTKLG